MSTTAPWGRAFGIDRIGEETADHCVLLAATRGRVAGMELGLARRR
jgi:hypothetical protein